MSTIKDVAQRAGVAISTVSAVLNRSAPVSERVVKKVEAAIAAVGYVPHAAARSLRSGHSRLVGLVLPDIANPHFAAVARVVEGVCLNAGYMAAVFSTSEDPDRETQILHMMQMQRVAGLLIIPTLSDRVQGEKLMSEVHVPTVLLDSYVEGMPYDVVKLDNVEAGRLATEHLLSLGHSRIAVTTGRPNIATGADRLAGYVKAHKAHRTTVDRTLFLPGNFRRDHAYRSTLEVMRRASPPTAIFALSNMMMLGVLEALGELGLLVPRDVSVVGIDDFETAALMNPPPTVVAEPVAEMAESAIRLLLREIAARGSPTGKWEIHQPQLVVRASTRRLFNSTPAIDAL
ncbi:MAG TPA: LacI family DNA-binding transcriptional regulator [Bauldia sp.]|nr:LacI family DNA-binding transcriptional regulator [Bauldia sp.]